MTNIDYPTNQPTNGMCGKIKIKKAYFYGGHVDLVWYGRNEIGMKIKTDCESILWCMEKYYDLKLNMIKKVFWGKKCVCDIGERGKKYGNKLYFDNCNGKWLMDFHIFCRCLYLLRI